ncbi:MAG: hypothetical protein WBN83_00110, partial [Desulfoprunum sp.]|uniref:hypothetical protein n=1 Tax=Desulfoprunum sp. TaxID=2020866 RepID=UPI003C74B681
WQHKNTQTIHLKNLDPCSNKGNHLFLKTWKLDKIGLYIKWMRQRNNTEEGDQALVARRACRTSGNPPQPLRKLNAP